ncbi:MAG: phosphohistidine phosphatase SixA [Verrucomicrobia bacterium]|nr:phosphohistidine phosphatase SixA [Verrucomicrobiota bacterium]
MNLLLLRHAEAVDDAPSDRERPLTEKGKRQAGVVGNYLREHSINVDLVLSSPAVRTMETAKIVARSIKLDVFPAPWALPGMDPESALRALDGFREFKRILLVGHQPDIGGLVAKLLRLPDAHKFHIRKASLFHLSLVANRAAILEAFVPCKLM